MFSLEAALETSLVRDREEGTSLEPIQASLGSLAETRAEPVNLASQTDPTTSFLVGAKIGPMTRSASKQGPST